MSEYRPCADDEKNAGDCLEKTHPGYCDHLKAGETWENCEFGGRFNKAIRLDVLYWLIHNQFSPKFGVENVKADLKWKDGKIASLSLKIGPRDVDFDEQGNIQGCGTDLRELRQEA